MLSDINFDDIKYVVVEATDKANKEIIVGYFKGLVYIDESASYACKVKDTYLILKNKETIFALKLENFIISTISIGIKINSWTLSKRSYSLKREKSIKFLQEIQEYYIDHHRTNKNGLIDVSGFEIEKGSYLSLAMKRYSSLNLNFNDTAKHINENNSGVVKTNNTNKAISTNTSNKGTIKTSILKRTTTYDKNKAINEMNTKIKMLKNNKYIVTLPIEESKNKDEFQLFNAYNDCNDEDFRPEYFYH